MKSEIPDGVIIYLSKINSIKTKCSRGHKYNYRNNGRRYCLICQLETNKRLRKIKKENPEIPKKFIIKF